MFNTSPFAVPICLSQKNASLRMCVDHRALKHCIEFQKQLLQDAFA